MTGGRQSAIAHGVSPATDAMVIAAPDPAGRFCYGRRGERCNDCFDTNPCRLGLGPRDLIRPEVGRVTGRRVQVVDCETYEHMRVRLGRERLTAALQVMTARLEECRNDPAIMLLIRCGAFTLELFSAHPVDKRGRCMRRGCPRLLGLSKRVCPTLGGLMFYSHADVATVWWRVLPELEGKAVPLSAVRDWLEGGATPPGLEHAGATHPASTCIHSRSAHPGLGRSPGGGSHT